MLWLWHLLRRLFSRPVQTSPTIQIAETEENDEYNRLINSMTNWQRNQWARAGYSQKIERLRYFAGLRQARGEAGRIEFDLMSEVA